MKKEEKSPLILGDDVTVSLEVPSRETNETVLLEDMNETVLLEDMNETVLLEDSNETVLLDDFAKRMQNVKHSRELYQLGEGEMLADRYIIGDILGFGGFGITYSAWDSKLEMKVAVKEYYPSNLVNRVPGQKKVEIYSKKQQIEFEKGLNRFLGEARNMAKFSGKKNIVNVYNYFKENGTAYLVMEFLDGVSLKEYTRQRGEKLPYEQVIQFTKGVIEALKILHKEHIIHRDISPDNIFICKDGSVKLIDFGAARFAAEEEEAKTLSVVLKPGYAPPEQYRSKGRQGPRTDIYALGATMYRTVTGIVPEESVNRAVKDDLKEPKEFTPEIPEYFNKILMKCLAIQPELRFKTVDELENKLDRRKTVSSVKQELRRRKLIRTILVTAALAIIGILGLKEYQYIQGLRNKANLVESTVSVWVPVKDDVESTKTMFEESIEDFKATYPYVEIQTEFISDEEYEERLEQAKTEGKMPTVFESSDYKEEEALADLSEIYEMLDLTQYLNGTVIGEQKNRFHRKMPTGFAIPLIYKNTVLGANEKPMPKENNLKSFLEGSSAYYVGTFEEYEEIQSTLAGCYDIEMPVKEQMKVEYLNLWSVNAQADEEQINAGTRLLYYLMSEQAQDIWYVQNKNGYPLQKGVLDTYINVNPEFDFLKELQIEESEQTTFNKEYLETIYQTLEKE